MPIPKPKKDESVSKFTSRCMGDKVMNKDYPDNSQRAEIYYNAYREAKKKQ